MFTKPPDVKLNACPGLKKSLIVISSITTSSSNKNALLLCVATVGLIIVFLMSSPTISTCDGTVSGNSSSYSPGNTCITVGPAVLPSTWASACFNVRNAPC